MTPNKQINLTAASCHFFCKAKLGVTEGLFFNPSVTFSLATANLWMSYALRGPSGFI